MNTDEPLWAAILMTLGGAAIALFQPFFSWKFEGEKQHTAQERTEKARRDAEAHEALQKERRERIAQWRSMVGEYSVKMHLRGRAMKDDPRYMQLHPYLSPTDLLETAVVDLSTREEWVLGQHQADVLLRVITRLETEWKLR